MKRSVKTGLIIAAAIVFAALLYVAVSDRVFFANIRLTLGDPVSHNTGNEQSFYMYKDSFDHEFQIEVATLFLGTTQYNKMAHITLEISPVEDHEIDALRFEFMPLKPVAALVVEDPESGQAPSFDYTRIDGDSSVTLDFPDPGVGPGEAVTFDFWLDLTDIDPVTQDCLLAASICFHQDTVLKVVKLNVYSAMELNLSLPPN